MDTRPLKDILTDPHEPTTVVLSDPSCTMLVCRIGAGETAPERRHVRSDVVLQVISGTAEVNGVRKTSVRRSQALVVPCGESYALGNPGPDPLVLIVVICPGVTTLESRPYGSVRCPVCSAEVAIEEGDLPGDRFICPDCTTWMRIVEAERGYVAEPS
ncbi:MAG TPA: hypothetical protein VMZ92_13215 [Planctomycetota bacterium]|nr:hypothetical protein [Planctomycetota bacterium]